MEATDASVQFTNIARERFMALKDRKGYHAIGAYDEHKDILSKDVTDIANKIKSPRAKEIFNKFAQQRIGATLDGIANYETSQLQVAKQGAVEAKAAEVMQAIDIGIDPEILDSELDALDASIDVLYAGTSAGAAKKYESRKKLVGAYLTSEAMRRPDAINDMIDRYDDYLDDKDKEGLRETARSFQVKSEIDALNALIEARTSDPEEQVALALEYAKSSQLSPQAKDSFIGRYRTRFATQQAVDDARAAEVQKSLDKTALDLWMAKNMEGIESLVGHMPDPDKGMRWLEFIHSFHERKRRLDKESDQSYLNDIRSKLMLDPTSVDPVKDLIMKVGTKLSDNDATRLISQRKALMETGTKPEVTGAIEHIQAMRDSRQFNQDPIENEAEYNKLISSLHKWVARNPDADPTLWLKEALKEYQRSWWNRLWDRVSSTEGMGEDFHESLRDAELKREMSEEGWRSELRKNKVRGKIPAQ
jgi:hypothetical protein